MLNGLAQGLATALLPINLAMVLAGCLIGTAIGMIPGLGPITAIALMIPLTYELDPASALILMAGVYYGAVFGGSTSSILINAPGESSSVATAFDGYPLARQGHAGKALAIAAYGSFAGGTIAAVFLLVAAPALAKVALAFHSPDYFAIAVFALAAVSAFAARGQLAKGVAMVVLGLMLATVGQDVASDVPRFTFGTLELLDGIDFVLLAMAIFALSEALLGVLRPELGANEALPTPTLRSLRLSRNETREILPTMGRSSILGFLIGILPGAGATIASFLAYSMERAIAPAAERARFGRGSLRGLAAPETASGAACTGAFVPLLTLGVPGSGTTAVILAALLSYGVQPGPRLVLDRPDVFWSVIVSMYIGNLVLLVLNLPLIPQIARVLAVPSRMLAPLVVFFSVMGVYVTTLSPFDLTVMVAIALAATLLRLLDYPMPPLALAFVLGPMMEENLRRAVILYDGSFSFLWTRPVPIVVGSLMAAIVGWRLWTTLRARRVVPSGSG
ncbi:MAG TPA: tripartite tricarboxylate transporter permease [Thermoanaerobaculia bacterium]|nr:tripartite tricarboxylate transporter permease [Thermoanaerobaculia bacterium]